MQAQTLFCNSAKRLTSWSFTDALFGTMCKNYDYVQNQHFTKTVNIFVIIFGTFCYRRVSEDDARSTFQLARSNAKHFAIVFVAWAQFELSTGLNPIILPFKYIILLSLMS